MGPFDLINDLMSKKEHLMQSDIEEAIYLPYITNRNMSQFVDCTMQANEMNRLAHLDKRMQYDYYFHSIRARKRFAKWAKAEKSDDVTLLATYFGYSESKTRQIMDLISKEYLEEIRQFMSQGGIANK